MKGFIKKEEIFSMIKNGMTLMVGGFLGVGTPEKLMDILIESDKGNFNVIVNDTAFPDKGIGRVIVAKKIKRLVTCHIGTNPETGKQYREGEIEIELSPQGTLVERIRAGGAGLGGVITPTGLGTDVEKGKQKITINGKEYLVETPLHAEIAFIKAAVADKAGNLVYKKTARNFNPIMAMAADIVIVEVERVVEVGSIDPDQVMTPGILVDYIYVKEG